MSAAIRGARIVDQEAMHALEAANAALRRLLRELAQRPCHPGEPDNCLTTRCMMCWQMTVHNGTLGHAASCRLDAALEGKE